MPSYGGTPFHMEHQGYHPLATREPLFESAHIPYSNRDDVQFGGLGNEHLTLEVVFDSLTAYNEMRAFLATPTAAVTTRPLVVYAADGTHQLSNGWWLRNISQPRRAANQPQQVIFCTLSFEREQP